MILLYPMTVHVIYVVVRRYVMEKEMVIVRQDYLLFSRNEELKSNKAERERQTG